MGEDIGLFEIIVILGLIGVGIYFAVQFYKWFTGCGPSNAATGAVTKKIFSVFGGCINGPLPTSCKQAPPCLTTPKPSCAAQSFWDWLAGVFGLSSGAAKMDQYYNPPASPSAPTSTPPASSTGIAPGSGQACGCCEAVLRCCSNFCYGSIGG